MPRGLRGRVSSSCSGIWFERSEGGKFWLQVLTELKSRRVQDVLVCSVDGLSGVPEAIARHLSQSAGPDIASCNAIRAALRAESRGRQFAAAPASAPPRAAASSGYAGGAGSVVREFRATQGCRPHLQDARRWT